MCTRIPAATRVAIWLAAWLAGPAIAAASLLPDSPGSGPFAAIYGVDPTLPKHVVFYPISQRLMGDSKLGVLVWANGGCRDDGAAARQHLADIASYGYLAIAPGSIKSGPRAPPGAIAAPRPSGGTFPPPATTTNDVRAGIDWALAQNARKGSPYYRHIDPLMIAVAGYSCGGLQALQLATSDTRVRAVMIQNSGLFPEGRTPIPTLSLSKSLLEQLRTPIIYIIGNKTDVAFPNATDDFSRISKVPALLASYQHVGHEGTYAEPHGGPAANVAAKWLQWQLRGDESAGRMFTGAECGLCVNSDWAVQRNDALLRAPAAGGLAVSVTQARAPLPVVTVRIDPHTLSAIGKVDERFQSYNVEMAEIIGGRFWKPYAHIDASPASRPAAASASQSVGAGTDLFETRAAVDLGNRRLRMLAAALGPAFIRVSGSWTNNVYFQDDDGPKLAKAPEGFQNVLTRAQWRGVIEFAHAVDARLVTSFAINAPVRDTTGAWTPVQARPFMAYTRAIGGEIYAAELFNEPNYSGRTGGPKNYSATDFARDSVVFRSFVAEAAPDMKIVGPGDTSTSTRVQLPLTEDFMAAQPRPRFDVISYHYYGAVSRRCAPDGKPPGTRPELALTEDWLAGTERAFLTRKVVRDGYAPGTPIWLTETAGSACGGSPWDSTFLDAFRYLDQLGRLARSGVSAIFHNTLAASEYGLIDEATLEPRPGYWGALLWRKLMGPVVLDAGEILPGFHVYAHCLRDQPGGVAVLAINNGDQSSSFEAPGSAELYLLTASAVESHTVSLNGVPLAVGSVERLPPLVPQRLSKAKVTLPARSIGFIAMAGAGNARCQ